MFERRTELQPPSHRLLEEHHHQMSSDSTPRRVAIVTGGTRGIGSGIASALADDQFDLLLTYNSNKEAAEAFVSDLKANHSGIQCEIVGGDLSLPKTRDAIFDCYDTKFGSSKNHVLGAVIHNAGQYVGVTSSNQASLPPSKAQFGNGSLLDKDGKPDFNCMKYYQALYGDAYIDLCERGIARMTADHGGSLIGVSSPGCNLTYSCMPGYSMPGSGKCIMEHTMRIIAVNAGAKNINCNVIVPGVTLSEAWDKVASQMGKTTDEVTNGFVQMAVPMQRPIQPQGIGDVASFLCSDKGRYITGVSLPVDGGLHLGGMRRPVAS